MMIPPSTLASYWQLQTAPDCVEQSVRIAVAVQKHEALSQGRLDAAATTLGYYRPGQGTYGPTAIPALLHHYGLSAHQASTSKATVIKDLAAGDSVIAVVNANTLWWTEGYTDGTSNTTSANHALTIDAITGGWVEVTDTGIPTGALDLVPWATFTHAWAASGWNATVAH